MGTMVWRQLPEAVYRQKVLDFLVREEGSVRHVYVDSVGVPTLGIGKALVVKGKQGWVVDPVGEDFLKQAAGQEYTLEQRRVLARVVENLRMLGAGGKAREAHVPLVHGPEVPVGSSVAAWRARMNPVYSRFGVLLALEEEVTFNQLVVGLSERGVPLWVPFSEERVALVSLYHNAPRVVAGVLPLLRLGDVAGAVRVIRRSGVGKGAVLMARRGREAGVLAGV